jgi:hypothetical protein
VHNPSGALRVVVTKSLPGDRWLKVLTASGCRVEVSADPDTIHSNDKIKKLIGDKCDGVIGQLTEVGGCWRQRRGGVSPTVPGLAGMAWQKHGNTAPRTSSDQPCRLPLLGSPHCCLPCDRTGATSCSRL